MRFNLLKQEHSTLRAEIIQSISYQHQMPLGGYAATGGFVGYVLSKTSEVTPALMVVPYILLGMTAMLYFVAGKLNIPSLGSH